MDINYTCKILINILCNFTLKFFKRANIMINKNFFVIFSLFIVLLCCFSAVSASEDVTNDISEVSDDVAVDEVVSEVDSDDESIAASIDEDLESVDDSGNESLAVQDEEPVNDVEEVDSTVTVENDNGQTPSTIGTTVSLPSKVNVTVPVASLTFTVTL